MPSLKTLIDSKELQPGDFFRLSRNYWQDDYHNFRNLYFWDYIAEANSADLNYNVDRVIKNKYLLKILEETPYKGRMTANQYQLNWQAGIDHIIKSKDDPNIIGYMDALARNYQYLAPERYAIEVAQNLLYNSTCMFGLEVYENKRTDLMKYFDKKEHFIFRDYRRVPIRHTYSGHVLTNGMVIHDSVVVRPVKMPKQEYVKKLPYLLDDSLGKFLIRQAQRRKEKREARALVKQRSESLGSNPSDVSVL